MLCFSAENWKCGSVDKVAKSVPFCKKCLKSGAYYGIMLKSVGNLSHTICGAMPIKKERTA